MQFMPEEYFSLSNTKCGTDSRILLSMGYTSLSITYQKSAYKVAKQQKFCFQLAYNLLYYRVCNTRHCNTRYCNTIPSICHSLYSTLLYTLLNTYLMLPTVLAMLVILTILTILRLYSLYSDYAHYTYLRCFYMSHISTLQSSSYFLSVFIKMKLYSNWVLCAFLYTIVLWLNNFSLRHNSRMIRHKKQVFTYHFSDKRTSEASISFSGTFISYSTLRYTLKLLHYCISFFVVLTCIAMHALEPNH